MSTENSKPKLCYIREPSNAPYGKEKRVIAIAMSYDKQGSVKYGATIFTRNKPGENAAKRALRKTAEERFAKRPVQFSMNMVESVKYEDVVTAVRKTMYKQGVAQKMQK